MAASASSPPPSGGYVVPKVTYLGPAYPAKGAK